MYKEPLISKELNRVAALRIEQKIADKITILENPDTTDDCFLNDLHDLCVLNRMKDSHDT